MGEWWFCQPLFLGAGNLGTQGGSHATEFLFLTLSEEWFELSMEEAWSYFSNHPISTTLRRALRESLKVINPPPNLVRFEQQGKRFRQVLGRLAWFSSLCLSCLSIYRESHFGWWTWFLVPKAPGLPVMGSEGLTACLLHPIHLDLRFKCLTYFGAEMEVYKVGPFKWPNQWVAGVITLLTGAMAPFVTGRGPPL